MTLTIFLFLISNRTMAQEQTHIDDLKNTALIIIDVQNFYFLGGSLPLSNPEEAAKNAQRLLKIFRENGEMIIHVKHRANIGADIHKLVAPIEGEKVISKNKANAFLDTDLLDYLRNNKIENLILCGMQTHMCLEATTRAASDFGFNCTVIEDACATRDLKFGDITISAINVHYSTLSSLNGTYAKIESTNEFLENRY